MRNQRGNTKGQLAVETLLIYGVVILVVLLAIGALVAFGVFDLGSLLPDTCNVQGASLGCEEYFLSKTDGFNLELSNDLGANIELLEILNVRPTNENDFGLLTGCTNLNTPFTIDGVRWVSSITSTPVGYSACTGAPNTFYPTGLVTTSVSAVCTGTVYDAFLWSGTACPATVPASTRCSATAPESDSYCYITSSSGTARTLSCTGQPVSRVLVGQPLLQGEKGSAKATTCLPVAQLDAGKKLKVDFEIRYRKVGSNLPRTASGKATVTVVE